MADDIRTQLAEQVKEFTEVDVQKVSSSDGIDTYQGTAKHFQQGLYKLEAKATKQEVTWTASAARQPTLTGTFQKKK